MKFERSQKVFKMTQHLQPNPQEEIEEEDSILQRLIVSSLFWKHAACWSLVMGLLGLGIFYLLPRIYQAETVLLSPTQSDRMGPAALSAGGGGSLAALAMGGGGGGLFKDANAQYIGILKSRTVADEVIKKLNLMHDWNVDSLNKARLKLEKAFSVKSTKEMFLSITVEDQSPVRAAEIAKAFVQALQHQSRKLAQDLAKQKSVFYREQFDHAAGELAAAEMQVRDMQKRNSALRIDDQTKLAMESVAYLQARISAVQVELVAAQRYAGPDNQDVQRLQSQLSALKAELSQQQAKPSGLSMPINSLPDAQVAYVRTLRQFKYAEIMYEMMAKQLEASRIEASSDGVWLQVLDEAVPPDLPIAPKRSICVLIGIIIGMILATIRALFTQERYLKKV